MPRTVLVVHLQIEEAQFDEFVALARAHGKRSMEIEKGCLSFEVLVCADQPHTVILVEAYRDDAALQEHWDSEHMAAYLEKTKAMIANRQRYRCTAA